MAVIKDDGTITPGFTPKAAVDWGAKDRSQLVGGRSHDAAQLVLAALTASVPISQALEMYKEALDGILKIAEGTK